MLPTGFSWRDYINGPGLYLGDRLIANAVQPSEGALWRLTYGVRENIPNTKFFSCEAAAKRYAEAWAVKWEARLRAWYTAQIALRERPPEPRGNLPTPEMVAKEYARRSGRRTKNWWLKSDTAPMPPPNQDDCATVTDIAPSFAAGSD